MSSIVFDFDGTLVDPSARHYDVYLECAAQFKGTSLSKDVYWSLKREGTDWSDILQASGIASSLKEDYLQSFIPLIESASYLDKDELFSDSIDILEYFKNKYKLYLISLRRDEDALLDQLYSLGINSMFEKVFTGHSDSKEGSLIKKADIIKEYNIKDVIIIGDSESEIVAAKKLGAPSVVVTTGVRSRGYLERYKPDYIVDRLTEVKALPIFRA